MKLKKRKSKRVTFGLFQNEKKALEYIEHHKKFRMKKGLDPNFFVVKKPSIRQKGDKKNYEAYCLIPR
tara:strand:+ start:4168 stop:4371 length:204 start_codon:yes stop_codon:yes gene_type:complete